MMNTDQKMIVSFCANVKTQLQGKFRQVFKNDNLPFTQLLYSFEEEGGSKPFHGCLRTISEYT